MNTSIYKNLSLGLLVGLLTSCTTYDDLVKDNQVPDDPNIPIIPGTANFSKYVALGNSQTAGFMDAALYTAGQSNSFPAILSKQFAMAGGGAFNQPGVGSSNGYNPLFSNPGAGVILGRLKLNVSTDPPSIVPTVGELLADFPGDRGSLNNFGVPGARVVDAVFSGYAAANPYYGRFASEASATMLGDAVAANGTFFSLWLGNNDVLGYSTGGGTTSAAKNDDPLPPGQIIVGVDGTGAPIIVPNVDPGTGFPLNMIPGLTAYYSTDVQASINGQGLDPSEITDPAVFTGVYQQVLTAMASTSSFSGGIALNIPDITAVPFFTTVPAAALRVPFDLGAPIPPELGLPFANFAEGLNFIYAQFGFATDPSTGLGVPSGPFTPSADNFFAIETFDASGNRIFRQLSPDEIVLLTIPTDSLLAGWGTVKGLPLTPDGEIDIANLDPSALRPFPIPSEYILDIIEIENIRTRTGEFNSAISSAVSATSGVELADAHAIFEQIKLAGVSPGEVPLSPNFGPAGMFSVDGIHTNQRGNSIIANEIIKVINDKFGANLPLADTWNYNPNDIIF